MSIPVPWAKTTAVLTFATDDDLTAAAQVDGASELWIEVPTIENAAITLRGSMDNSDYNDIYTLCGESVNPKKVITVAGTGDFALVFPPGLIPVPKYIKLFLSAAQTADRTFNVYYR